MRRTIAPLTRRKSHFRVARAARIAARFSVPGARITSPCTQASKPKRPHCGKDLTEDSRQISGAATAEPAGGPSASVGVGKGSLTGVGIAAGLAWGIEFSLSFDVCHRSSARAHARTHRVSARSNKQRSVQSTSNGSIVITYRCCRRSRDVDKKTCAVRCNWRGRFAVSDVHDSNLTAGRQSAVRCRIAGATIGAR